MMTKGNIYNCSEIKEASCKLKESILELFSIEWDDLIQPGKSNNRSDVRAVIMSFLSSLPPRQRWTNKHIARIIGLSLRGVDHHTFAHPARMSDPNDRDYKASYDALVEAMTA